MDNLSTQLASLAEKLGEHGPKVVDAAYRATHFDGVLQLWGALGSCIGSGILLGLAYYVFKKHDSDGCVILAIISFILFIATIALLFADNPWMKVFDPEAAVVKALFF